MTDITTFTTQELLKDYADSQMDISRCEDALLAGVTTYGGNLSVRARLEANRGIVHAIENELARRGLSIPAGVTACHAN